MPAITFIKVLRFGLSGPSAKPTLPPALKNLLTPSLPKEIKSL
jgi:hypothetical protein